MSTEKLQYWVEERKSRKSFSEILVEHHRMPDGKLIATVQICYRCGRQFSYNRKRRHCPSCQALLRTKMMLRKPP